MYLRVEDVAELLHVSTRSIHELTRANRIPCRRIAGTRRYICVPDEISQWLDGAALEVDDPDTGAKVIRPVASS
jgi:excisionase family DNA binding protein